MRVQVCTVVGIQSFALECELINCESLFVCSRTLPCLKANVREPFIVLVESEEHVNGAPSRQGQVHDVFVLLLLFVVQIVFVVRLETSRQLHPIHPIIFLIR